MKQQTANVVRAFLQGMTGAGLFRKLNYPGAPVEFVDSRAVGRDRIMTTATMSRVDELNDLQDRARGLNVRDDAAFQSILRDARTVLEMSESQIADALSISRPTFNRWINGRSLPHIAMRTPAITWVLDQLKSKIKNREFAGQQEEY